MSDPDSPSVDVLVFGGGIAGLWLLDELVRQNYSTLLLEPSALGDGQTVASQGIIHGGLKYMFDGQLTAPAKAISEMPALWQDCLAGRREPDLSGTQIRSHCCYIWGTASLKSKLFLKGSSFALRAAPTQIEDADRPAALEHVPGRVLRLPEQVLDPVSLMERLAARNRSRVLSIDPGRGPDFDCAPDGTIVSVRVHCNTSSRAIPSGHGSSNPQSPFNLRPNLIVLAAGQGNALLREKVGLAPGAMQLRPLHMVMVRGELPPLFGHCVGGPKPRLTITSAIDSAGRSVWQVGGQIAEDGVQKDMAALVKFARKELMACIPGLNLSSAEFATYRIDRAEAATPTGQRPDDVHVIREGNVITAWPTKLALAPRLAQRIIEVLDSKRSGFRVQGSGSYGDALPGSWPSPAVALPPWEKQTQWVKATD